MIKQTDWFQTWFNTKYYHILYKNRDYDEAKKFVDVLVDYLKPKQEATFMDLACGRGRHARYLNQKGYNVVGTDLSEQSIAHAKNAECDSLRYMVNDMRDCIDGYSFDFILNLFTSFGYFDSRKEDEKVIQACAEMLHPGGKLVIDYINIDKAIAELCPFEIKNIDGIDFQIKKFMEHGFLKKEISFRDNDTNEKFNFLEKVKIFYPEDFQELMENAGLKVENIFGNYQLDRFDPDYSDRMIFVACKN